MPVAAPKESQHKISPDIVRFPWVGERCKIPLVEEGSRGCRAEYLTMETRKKHRETEIKALPCHGMGSEHPGTREKSTGNSKDVPGRVPRGKRQRKEQKGEFLTVKAAGCLGVGNTEKRPLGLVKRSPEGLTVSFPEAECDDEAK